MRSATIKNIGDQAMLQIRKIQLRTFVISFSNKKLLVFLIIIFAVDKKKSGNLKIKKPTRFLYVLMNLSYFDYYYVITVICTLTICLKGEDCVIVCYLMKDKTCFHFHGNHRPFK